MLNINIADLGYDKAGMDRAYQAIHTELIEEAIKQMETGIETTQINMGDFWVGASADMFKQKMDVDYLKLARSLRAIDAGLIQEFYQMMYNVNNSDATIAEDILAGIDYSSGFLPKSNAGVGDALTSAGTAIAEAGVSAISTASTTAGVGGAIAGAGVAIAEGTQTVVEGAAVGASAGVGDAIANAGTTIAEGAQVAIDNATQTVDGSASDDEVKAIVDDNKKEEVNEVDTKAEEEAQAKAEEEARIKAEEEAQAKAEEEARIKAEEEAKAKAEEEAKAKAEEEARVKAEEEAQAKAEEEAKAKAEEEARVKAEEEARVKAEQEAATQKAQEEAARQVEEQQAQETQNTTDINPNPTTNENVTVKASNGEPDYTHKDSYTKDEIDTYITDVCNKYGVDKNIILAQIETESNFKVNVTSKANCQGLMQLNPKYFESEYGLYDPKANIEEGVSYLSSLINKYGSVEKALVCYNMGEGGAKGIDSSKYSRVILSRSEEYANGKDWDLHY